MLFIILLICSIGFVLYLSLTTSLDVMKSYHAKWDGTCFLIDEMIPFDGGTIYAYENRNDRIFQIEIGKGDISTKENQTYILIKEFAPQFSSNQVMLDIPVRKNTLFEHVFLHGGTNE